MSQFKNTEWIRKSFGVSFDERPAQIMDFTFTVPSFQNTYPGGYVNKGTDLEVKYPAKTGTFTTYASFFATATPDGGVGAEESAFYEKFKLWEIYSSYFMMKRAVMTVGLVQRCYTRTIKAGHMSDFIKLDSITPLPRINIPGADSGAVPAGEGKWFIESFNVEDSQDQFSNCSLSLRSIGKWTLIKIGTGTPEGPSL